MKKTFLIVLMILSLIPACTDVPSTSVLESDITGIESEINDARKSVSEYQGGLLSILASSRLETLLVTKAMLEQKKTGFKRFISMSYTVDGKGYIPPSNKLQLLQDMKNDISKLRKQLEEAELENRNYSGGLLGVLSLTNTVAVKVSMAFLEQKMLLLKHDVPYYFLLADLKDKGVDFVPTPGEDVDKF
jgi:hypothetical protein